MTWIVRRWFEIAMAAVLIFGTAWLLVGLVYLTPHSQHYRIDLYEGGKIIQTWHGRMAESGPHLVYFIDDETGKMIGVRGTIVTTPEGKR